MTVDAENDWLTLSKAFSLHVKDASCRIDTCWTLGVDGVKIQSLFLQPPYQGECERTSCLKAVQVSPTERRGLVFSKINVTGKQASVKYISIMAPQYSIVIEFRMLDDEVYLNRTTHLNLGEITLDVWTAQYTERTVPVPFVRLSDEPVHEKSKKSGTHCIGSVYLSSSSITLIKAGLAWAPLRRWRLRKMSPRICGTVSNT